MEILIHDNELDILANSMESISSDAVIVEWGSGGSTKWWLEHMGADQRLISIEHTLKWVHNVNNELKKHPRRCDLTYVYAEPNFPASFYGYASPTEENPSGLEDYILPKELSAQIKNAELFFVDGIARAAVLSAIRGFAIHKDARVFIHDYVGRENWYDWAVSLYSWNKEAGETMLRMGIE